MVIYNSEYSEHWDGTEETIKGNKEDRIKYGWVNQEIMWSGLDDNCSK